MGRATASRSGGGPRGNCRYSGLGQGASRLSRVRQDFVGGPSGPMGWAGAHVAAEAAPTGGAGGVLEGVQARWGGQGARVAADAAPTGGAGGCWRAFRPDGPGQTPMSRLTPLPQVRRGPPTGAWGPANSPKRKGLRVTAGLLADRGGASPLPRPVLRALYLKPAGRAWSPPARLLEGKPGVGPGFPVFPYSTGSGGSSSVASGQKIRRRNQMSFS